MSKKIMHFISSQSKQVHKAGITVLLPKLWGLFLVLLSMPIVLLIRLIRPLVVVRFGALRSERIGHFASNTEIYLCKRDLTSQKPRNFDLFYCEGPVSNYQLKRMWSRVLPIYNLIKWVDKVNRLLPKAREHTVDFSADRDVDGLIKQSRPHISFTAQEEALGRKGLADLGISCGSSFVCFQARDSAYLENTLNGRSWDYHDYRNSNINNYIPAAQALAERGYFPIRMGSMVKERLDNSNLKIIDYATKGRTDFLDIYLGAKCRFFLCDTVGTYAIAEIFRRPIAWVNFIPLELVPTWRRKYLFIPKKLWLRVERRFLTFKEILDFGIGRFLNSQRYEKASIEVIDNAPEEILALSLEMDDRLKGVWQETEEDRQLQKRFWELFRISDVNHIFLSRIGAQFLRQNQELMPQKCLL